MLLTKGNQVENNQKMKKEQEININFYSRQIGTYGLETMNKLKKKNIFIYGLRGVGFEIAKNLILAGPRKVTIFDENISKINDLSSNFYITEEDVKSKKRRDYASLKKLSELNNNVKVDTMEGNSIIKHLTSKLGIEEEKYSVVTVTQFSPKNFVVELNNFCRNNEIGFIYGTELGINGFYFVDFGDKFIVNDENNDEEKFIINKISKSNPGKINLANSIDRKIKNNDSIIIKEIEGMTELNENESIQIKKIDNYNIEINKDTSNFSDYISGGYIQKAKISLEMNFSSFEQSLEVPYTEEVEYPAQIDFGKSCFNEIIHIGILALYEFLNQNHNSFPELNSKKDAEKLFQIAKKILKEKENDSVYWVQGLREEIENFDMFFYKIIIGLSLWAKAQISPIASFLGGLISQTIIKHTGKFKPTKQWFWFNFNEIIENVDINAERTLKGTNYDDQIAIFGDNIQKKLEGLNIFIIGAGALGCEFLKCFSEMGISTSKSKNSIVTITDNDYIEESNLNRQFLFRMKDIGLSKSEVASNYVKNMNHDFKCIPLKGRVGQETENIFNENFWKKQDFIINAVDNVEARIYINQKCIQFGKILINSGTNGTKANSQVIIPNETLEYSPPSDKDESIPMCTLRNYPTSINHCIEWTLEKFHCYFIEIINKVKLFVENKDEFYQELSKQGFITQKEIIIKVIRYLKIIINKDYNEILKIAFEEYNESFVTSIKRTLANYPPDFINSDGTKFWSGNKRCPKPINFDIKNNLAIDYIKSYGKILANEMSIPIENNDDLIAKKLNEFIHELIENDKIDNIRIVQNNKRDYRAKNNNYEEENEEQKIQLSNEKKLKIKERLKKHEEEINKLKEELDNIDITNLKNNSENIFFIKEFEKDDDENGHIDFIFAASNLRAQSFKIPKEDKIKVKFIAGKIIPAIASTTASIVGLVSLQLYTLCQNYNINSLRDCKFDLANNFFDFSCPIAVPEKPEKKEIFSGFKDLKKKISDKLKEIFKF